MARSATEHGEYYSCVARADIMDAEQLKHLALIAHHCYGSYDLTTRCIHQLVSRGALSPDSVGQYLKIVAGPG
jgi:hypothetical protein